MQEQIEEILQARLPYSPFAGRAIHIHTSVDGGVAIEVDGKYYDGVGSVPQADVQEFLRSVVQEWESRQ